MEHWYGLPEALFNDRTVQDYPLDYNYQNEQHRFGEAGRLWTQAAEPYSDHWNEVMDELALEKSDFKGLSAADKVVTLYKELSGYKPKYPHVSLDEALSNTTDAVREAWGAV